MRGRLSASCLVIRRSSLRASARVCSETELSFPTKVRIVLRLTSMDDDEFWFRAFLFSEIKNLSFFIIPIYERNTLGVF
uniref:Uncharacterized protein n=1 Tax=Cannabis sativa TaxID=3483 RepID=A0A803RCL6_CANSA